MKTLLTITAILEAVAGLTLLVVPAPATSLLLGAPLDAPEARTVARIGAAALLALGVACWMARSNPDPRAARGVIAGMLVYNVGVVAVLTCGAMVEGLRGAGLWPAAVLHTALSVWCLACLVPSRGKPSSTVAPEKQAAR